MKKFLSMAAILAVTVSLVTATAEEDPKKDAKETKMSCCSSKASDAKASSCGEKVKASEAKATKTSTKENCDKSKCADECKTTKQTDAGQSESKN